MILNIKNIIIYNMENNFTFYSGMISGAIQTIVGHPLDTLKTFNQTNNKLLYKPKLLYNGMTLPLLTNTFVTGLQFHTFQHYPLYMGLVSSIFLTPIEYYKIQKQVHNYYPKKLPNGFFITFLRESIALNCYFNSYNYFEKRTDVFTAGGIAGSLSWLVTYPLDTIKTRIQTYNDTFIDALKKQKLFKGLFVTLVRGFIVNGSGFLSISLLQKYYNKKTKD